MEVGRAAVEASGPRRPPPQRVATFGGQRGHRIGDGRMISAVAVHQYDTRGPVRTAHQLDHERGRGGRSDRQRAGKVGVLTRGADRDRRADHQTVGVMDRTFGDLLGDQRVGRQRKVGSVLLGRPDRDEQDRSERAVVGSPTCRRGRIDLVPRCITEVHGVPSCRIRSGLSPGRTAPCCRQSLRAP